MAIPRDIFPDSSSTSSRPVTSSSSASEKRLSTARATLRKNLSFRSKSVGSKSHNGSEQQTPIPSDRGRSEVPTEEQGGGSGSDQLCAESVDFLDSWQRGEDKICEQEKIVPQIDIETELHATDWTELPVTVATKTGEEGLESVIMNNSDMILDLTKLSQTAYSTRKAVGQEVRPELENFVFLKSPPACEEDPSRTILEKETDSEAAGLSSALLQKADNPRLTELDSPQPENKQNQRRLVRLAISLLSSDTEAAALVIDEAHQDTKELSSITSEEAHILETAFQILRSELRTHTQHAPRSGRSQTICTKKWCLFPAAMLLAACLVWLKWYLDVEHGWLAALPT